MVGGIGVAQPLTLTLAQARDLALRNRPRVASASLIAQAVGQTVTQARAAFYPTVAATVTGAVAQQNAVLTAGTLQTSSLYNRMAAGVSVAQLVTDFGRTGQLAASARLKSGAQTSAAQDTRAQVLLEVELAYYQTLGARGVLQAAQAALDSRRLLLRQVSALARSNLKSTLDVSFAEVSVSEAELALYGAQNEVEAGQVRLAFALGLERSTEFQLSDEPVQGSLPADLDGLVRQALNNRPDLAALGFARDAALRYAEAEKRLGYPTVQLLGAAGGTPLHDERLHGSYSSLGVNVNIPVLNGGLFAARRQEAELRARAASDDARDLALAVERDVRVAWLAANTAFRRLAVTARLVQESDQALRLAQIRYDNGLGSIVELSQAQAAQTSARMEAAGARYEYLGRRATLDFTIGASQ
jgi:outer membrane protein